MTGVLDIGGHPLGRPAKVVPVRTKEDLRAALASARAGNLPFAAMGLRATYWHNLSIEGAVVADLTGYDQVLDTHERDGYVTVQSGVPVRRLDQHLRRHGGHLPMHPDAYGDTPVGSSFANGATAGIGMMWGSFADQVVGLEVMLASGDVIQLGASRMVRGGPGPVGRGIPDLSSLFFGAEGALGLITELDVALVPAPWEARLAWRANEDRFARVLEAGLHWRRRRCAETIRWVWTGGEGELTIIVASRVGAGELQHRVVAVQASLGDWPQPSVDIATDAERRGELPDYERKWPGPAGATWERAVARPFAGIDAVVPYSRASEAYLWAKQVALTVPHEKRVAAYLGDDGVNLGIHCSFPDAETRRSGLGELEARMSELASFDAVPYRPGLVWMKELAGRWDPNTVDALGAVARALDPERAIPGAGLLSVVVPRAKDRR